MDGFSCLSCCRLESNLVETNTAVILVAQTSLGSCPVLPCPARVIVIEVVTGGSNLT
jgi:hypothetical protein